MNDAVSSSDILNRLADIELPAPPDWQSLMITGGVIIIAVLLIVLLRLYVRHSKKISAYNNRNSDATLTARLKLQQLINEWQSHTVNDREAAYRLTTLLRLGLRLPQLTHICPPHISADQRAWQETVSLCTNLRYQKIPVTHLSLKVFQRVEQWLIKFNQHNDQGV